jgi:hypothetical protein
VRTRQSIENSGAAGLAKRHTDFVQSEDEQPEAIR